MLLSRLISLSAALLALAVILGAFGAHGLKDVLGNYEKEIFEKAVFYHFIHALGALVVALSAASGTIPAALAKRVCALLFVGVIFFSGSLYLLALTGERWLGAITPVGGICFILAWGQLAWSMKDISTD